jgi:hypothetical protein
VTDKYVHLLPRSNRVIHFPREKCAICGQIINQVCTEKVHLDQVYALRTYTFDTTVHVPYCANHIALKNRNEKIAKWALMAFAFTFIVSAIIILGVLKLDGVLILFISLPASAIAGFATYHFGGGKGEGFSVQFASLEKTRGTPVLSFRFSNEEIAEEFKQLNNASQDLHELEFVYGIKNL